MLPQARWLLVDGRGPRRPGGGWHEIADAVRSFLVEQGIEPALHGPVIPTGPERAPRAINTVCESSPGT